MSTVNVQVSDEVNGLYCSTAIIVLFEITDHEKKYLCQLMMLGIADLFLNLIIDVRSDKLFYGNCLFQFGSKF